MKIVLIGAAALALTTGLAIAEPANTGSSDPAANAGSKTAPAAAPVAPGSDGPITTTTTPGDGVWTPPPGEDKATGNNADRDKQGSKSAE